jgi:hypothetical protein
MLLALAFSDAALSARPDGYRVLDEQQADRSAPHSHLRAWSPRVEWPGERDECPIFFRHGLDGFGQVRVGPRCREDDGLPHAL